MELTDLSAKELAAGYRSKDFSVSDVVSAYLMRIEKENPKLNAYLEVFNDSKDGAKAAEKALAEKGESAPALTGIPIATKDNILIEGKIASAGSKILGNHTATYDATIISKLKAAGALFLGRTNMDEFAFGSSTENSAFGPTRNPHAIDYIPGGTSGGSAAAVAARLAPVALGTDTGGSIRFPASMCGVIGLKPTYGAASRSGLIAAGSSFDQPGVLGRTVGDVESVFSVIAGHDPLDGTTLPDHLRGREIPFKKKIGVPRSFFKEGIESEVMRGLEETLAKLKRLGYELIDIELPNISYSLAAYYILIFAEESTNVSRFDGMRYGVQVEGDTLLEDYEQSKGRGFGPETKRRVILGTYVLSAGYYDAYYRRANILRGLILDDFKKAFTKVDAVIMPTSPTLPFKIGEKSDDPLAMYLSDIFTVSPNLTGLPAISIPVGFGIKDGVSLPIGMQFTSPKMTESSLLSIARDILGEH